MSLLNTTFIDAQKELSFNSVNQSNESERMKVTMVTQAQSLHLKLDIIFNPDGASDVLSPNKYHS